MSDYSALDYFLPVNHSTSSDQLLDRLWVEPEQKSRNDTPEDRVQQALQRALDNTTPERPGVPWEEEEKNERQRGWTLPQGD